MSELRKKLELAQQQEALGLAYHILRNLSGSIDEADVESALKTLKKASMLLSGSAHTITAKAVQAHGKASAKNQRNSATASERMTLSLQRRAQNAKEIAQRRLRQRQQA